MTLNELPEEEKHREAREAFAKAGTEVFLIMAEEEKRMIERAKQEQPLRGAWERAEEVETEVAPSEDYTDPQV